MILSGTGADGTEGMKAIKNAGGILIASDPESAEFNQMPTSAINTGMVDYIIPPDEMPGVIQKYVDKKISEAGLILTEEEEDKMIIATTDLIKDKLPEDFSRYKKSTILRRIKRRAALHNLSNLKTYFDLLKKVSAELQKGGIRCYTNKKYRKNICNRY